MIKDTSKTSHRLIDTSKTFPRLSAKKVQKALRAEEIIFDSSDPYNTKHKTMKISQFKMPKLTPKTVWVGAYGGHTDLIVLFSKMPVPEEDGATNGNILRRGDKQYCPLTNEELIVGAMWLDQFKKCYPDADISSILDKRGRPLDIEITKLLKIRLEIPMGSNGHANNIDFYADGW